MTIILGYILLFIAIIALVIAIALESTSAIIGVVSIAFASSCILKYKLEDKSMTVDLLFWASSMTIMLLLILEYLFKYAAIFRF